MVSSWRTVTSGASGPASASGRARDHVAERRVDVEAALVAQRSTVIAVKLCVIGRSKGRVGVGCGPRVEVSRPQPPECRSSPSSAMPCASPGTPSSPSASAKGVDGRSKGAHPRSALGVGEVGVHVRGVLVPASPFRPPEHDSPAAPFFRKTLSVQGDAGSTDQSGRLSSPDQDASGRFYVDLFGAERLPAPNFGYQVVGTASPTPSSHNFPRTTRRRSGITSASRSTTSSRSTVVRRSLA